MVTILRRALTTLLGLLGAYCTLWPIQDDVARWVVFFVFVILMVVFWVADAVHERRSSTEEDQRNRRRDASALEIQRHLRDQVPLTGTLKERARNTAVAAYGFLQNRARQEPDWLEQMRGLTGQALADVYVRFGEFHAETLALYQQRFGRRASAIAEELFAAAVLTRDEVTSIRNCDSDLFLSERVIRNLLRGSDSLPD